MNINSETAALKAVILHTPGKEVENMTPSNAHKALYSDILSLPIAEREYRQLSGVLSKVADTYQVSDLLKTVLDDTGAGPGWSLRFARPNPPRSLPPNSCVFRQTSLPVILLKACL